MRKKFLLCLVVTAGLGCFFGSAWGQRDVRSQIRPQINQARQYLRQAYGYLPQVRRENPALARTIEQHLNIVRSGLNQLDNMQWGMGSGRNLQTINPFGDYLFHGVPIRPSDGKLVTRHLDPQGIAARAEEWARELHDISRGLTSQQSEERQKFVNELNEKLKLVGLDPQHQPQMSDLGAGKDLKPEGLGEDLSVAGLPRLEGDTPALLRDPFGRDDPTMAPAPIRPSIDQIEVPAPPMPQITEGGSFWQDVRDGRYLGTGIGQWSAEWYADRYVETGNPAWYGAGLAASLWTPDTYLQTATTLATAYAAGGYLGRVGAGQAATGTAQTALAPRHVFLNDALDIDINARNVIYHIKNADGSVKVLPWRVEARIIWPSPGSAPRHVSAPKHVFLSADEFMNIDVNARNIIYHIRHPDGAVKTMQWFVDP